MQYIFQLLLGLGFAGWNMYIRHGIEGQGGGAVCNNDYTPWCQLTVICNEITPNVVSH